MKRMGIIAAFVAFILLTGCSENTSVDVDSTIAETTSSSTTLTISTTTTTEETTATTTACEVDFVTTSSAATTDATTTSTTSQISTSSTTKVTTTTRATTTVATATNSTAKTTTDPTTTTIATTTAPDTRPTVMWADMNISIYCNYDDPWEYPYDLETCLRDCQAYVEEKGLTWDDSLTMDNSTWAGSISSVPYAAWGGEPTFKSDVFARIDIEIQSWSTDRHYNVLFIPLSNPPFEGCYEVFVIHN